MYCLGESATQSGKPANVITLATIRPAWAWPRRVIDGTPIHSDSHAVVWPVQGKGSSATSMSW